MLCLCGLSYGNTVQNFQGLSSNISDPAWVHHFIQEKQLHCYPWELHVHKPGNLYLHLGNLLPNSQLLTAWHNLKWGLYLQGSFCRLQLIELASNWTLNNQNLFPGKNTLFPMIAWSPNAEKCQVIFTVLKFFWYCSLSIYIKMFGVFF